ncbi:dihydrodipicolinate synthase family protein [Ornithinimicrobium tianjinense]|uniref:Dihydrodipicolinate synthase family protein n=1 Tax=Ornithinimicrobium tianjinense TaxID=1195761 RepID=A0A917F359_9MICO|nr:dihydrodipicolinate synthase family protein [Ornithinimicrobium tianjinense]GGF40334.1 dihydrodipicolinate synthase family protein [Ornithinimicrobium tianjinense]
MVPTVPGTLTPGLWVILTTPFLADGQVDLRSARRQVRFARQAGADGLVALGVFGEAAHLSLEEQRAVVEVVAEEAAGIPLVLGVAGRSTAVVVEQAQNALQAAGRPAALMVQLNSPDPTVVVRHLTAVHEATGMGVVVQDYPVASGVVMVVDRVVEVVQRCPFLVAVKAEAPPTPPAISRLSEVGAVPVFGGLGGVGLIDELAMGAAGAMTGFSHPEGLRATLDAFATGGVAAARDAWSPWLPLATFEQQHGIALALRKMLLHRRGVLDHPGVRPPAATMPDRLLALLEDHLAAVQPLLLGEASP